MAWGQSMLGTTLWVCGDAAVLDVARRVLVKGGLLVECGVDRNGARMLR
jgi:hypothetical protein